MQNHDAQIGSTTYMLEVTQILANGILRLKQKETNRQSEALNVSEKGLDVSAQQSVNGDGPGLVAGLVDMHEAINK